MTVSPESTLPGLRISPEAKIIFSVVVVFPASTCAIIPIFLIKEEENLRKEYILSRGERLDGGF